MSVIKVRPFRTNNWGIGLVASRRGFVAGIGPWYVEVDW